MDFENGQKTGFFLDQKYNRRAVARLAAGHTVLDCFTHTGSFALNAAAGGAARVTAADISAEAIAMAQRNAQRNGLTNMDFLCKDTFELLPRLEREGHPYDFIILDPPAFTKARRTVENAMRGYKEINYRAMKLLPRGGYLATASCSHFATEELFIKMAALLRAFLPGCEKAARTILFFTDRSIIIIRRDPVRYLTAGRAVQQKGAQEEQEWAHSMSRSKR